MTPRLMSDLHRDIYEHKCNPPEHVHKPVHLRLYAHMHELYNYSLERDFPYHLSEVALTSFSTLPCLS